MVALPTNVSVAAGKVKVLLPATSDALTTIVPDVAPLYVIPPVATAEDNVLLVRVCKPVSVATVESMAIVTAPEPV